MWRVACVIFILALLTSTGCNKTELEIDRLKKKAEEYKAVITSRKYQLTEFYSDKPIDYILDDTAIRRETALWSYVKPYLKDDENFISPEGNLVIAQKINKIPTIDSSFLYRTYQFTNDAEAVYFDFVDYFYKPQKYKVSSMDSTYILIYIDWPGGAKLYSRFSRIN